MSDWLGDRVEDSPIDVYFTTHDGDGAAGAPSSAFEAADVKIYKNGSVTQKATTNGLTMTSPFDSVVGLHLLTLDTSDDTGDAGFWTVDSRYSVVLDPDETVDTQVVVRVLAQFSIEQGIAAAIETKADTIITDTNELQQDWVNGGRLDAILDLILADTGELQTDWVDGGRLDALIDLILADTAELQGDWVNTGRLDTILDAINTVTANLPDSGNLTALLSSIADILTDTGTTLPATLSTISTNVDDIETDTGTTLPATLAALDGKIDIIDTNVDDIETDTSTTLPATLSTLDGKIDDILTDTGTTLPATLATLPGGYTIFGGGGYDGSDVFYFQAGIYKDGAIANATNCTMSLRLYEGTEQKATGAWDSGPTENSDNTWYATITDASDEMDAGKKYTVRCVFTVGGVDYPGDVHVNA